MTVGDCELAIETVGLTKQFPLDSGWRGLFTHRYREALCDVSIQVRRGEVFGLLGPNGAGKTTLMKILATLVRPNSGTAYVNGLDVTKHGTEVRRLIGVVYGDERTFFWRLSVRENLRFYGALYRVPTRELARRIDEVLRLVGLQEAADMRMYRLSTGMKQRASIARGLLSNPELLFMDEPTRSLDPIGARDTWDLVRDRVLSSGRTTVLLCTNNMDEAEILCDRVAVIDHGAVRLMGSVTELDRMLRTHDHYELVLSGLEEWERAKLEQTPGVVWMTVEPTDDARSRLNVAVDRPETIPELVRQAVSMGASVWSCGSRELSLEQIFHFAVRGHDPAQAPSLVRGSR